MSKYIYTPSALVEGSVLTTSEAPYFTVSDDQDSVAAIIKEIWLLNTDSVERTVNIYCVPIGDSSEVANCILYNQPVPVGLPIQFSCFKTILPGTSIVAVASSASVIALSVSGVEVVTI